MRVLKSICAVAAETGSHPHFRRQVERLHRLGPRAVGEFLAEIGAERSIANVIDRKLDTYTEVKPEALEATGGDDFPPNPIHEVRKS